MSSDARFALVCMKEIQEMLPYVFIVIWTSNNIDQIHTKAFQKNEDASRFHIKLKLLCDQGVQDRVIINGELMDFDFRGADRVEMERLDVF